MRGLGPIAVALTAVACTATIPQGQLVCTDESQCPPGWSCIAERCYEIPFDGGAEPGIDASSIDATSDGGTPPPDGGQPDAPDGGPPDGGIPHRLAAIAAGAQHTCALSDQGRAWCWGGNDAGQLGNDSTALSTSAVLVSSVPPFDAICAGNLHTCALSEAGEIWCWGSNAQGQVGASDMGASYDEPVRVVAAGGTRVACGASHTCAIIADALWCWGDNGAGQIGDDTRAARAMPVRVVMPPSDVVAITAGAADTCALTGGGVASCWGHNWYGQLGDMETATGFFGFRAVPAPVDTTIVLGSIEAGGNHTCAITTDGDALCWGANGSAQLGEAGADRAVPMGIVPLGGAEITSITAGTAHTCTLAGGDPTCWGQNQQGQIGNGMASFTDPPPTALAFMFTGDVLAISAGGAHTCAIEERRVLCWGDNAMGQLGNRTTTDASSPVVVLDLDLAP